MFKTIIKTLGLFLCFPVVVLSQDESTIDPNGYNIFYYENGQVSAEGYFKNGKPTGLWKTYYETGQLKSEGKRVKDKPDSTWLFYREDGALIEKINYEDGNRSGFTFQYNEEGLLKSKVHYENDVKTGKGFLYYPELQTIQEERFFVEGKPESTAYEYNKKEEIVSILTYEKGFLKDRMDINRRDPKGKKVGLWITYYNDVEPDEGIEKAKQLEGRYRNGLKNGYFREYDRNGELLSTLKYIDGKVVENAEELMAVEKKRTFHPNAQIEWEKNYLNGKEHGIWKKYDDSGHIVDGAIYNKGVLLGKGVVDHQGLKQGTWLEYFETGELRAKGEYKDGARYGEWKFFFKNEQTEQTGKYIAGGKPHGMWRWYYEDGSLLRKEEFRNGREDGEIVEYDREGNILLKGYYVSGLRDGDWMIISGDYKMEGKYIDGYRFGTWEHRYLKENELAFKGDFIDGLPDGKHRYYHPNGNRKLIGNYEAGSKQGDWRRYNEQGVLLLTIDYDQNKDDRINGKKVKP